MSLPLFLSILRARWISMVIVLTLVVAGTVGVTLFLPKQYTSRASVLVDVKSPDPIAGMVFPGMMSPSYMATQVDVIKSERVGKRVVRSLKLNENPGMRAQWQEATKGVGEFDVWMAQLLLRSLDVKPSRESNVIDVTYKSVDPRFSSVMANAFVNAYVETSLDLRVEPAKRYTSFFDSRAKELRDQLEQAQVALSAYQKSKGIIATDERLDVENSRLAELSTQVVMLQTLGAESASRRNKVADSADAYGELLANGLVGSLKGELARLEAKLEELTTRLGDAHPLVRETRAQAGELRSKVEQETAKIGRSVGVTDDVNQSRLAQARGALEAQRAKVLRMKELRDEQGVLVRDVENAQRAYDGVIARANQTQLESQTTQTNVSVLNEAAEPTTPSSPKLLLNALLSVFVGTLLATATALALEFGDRRVRLASDIAQTLGAPVIGVLNNVRRRGRIRLSLRSSALRRSRLLGPGQERPLAIVKAPPAPDFVDTAQMTADSIEELSPTAGAVAQDRLIGDILREARGLDDDKMRAVIRHMREHEGMRFGDAAVALKFVEPEDVLWALSQQFHYQYASGKVVRLREELIVATDPFSDMAESLRDLRSHLLPHGDGPGSRRSAIAVVSPNCGDGKTFLAANLAIAFSQLGERTLLIDADMRTPRMHKLFGVENTQGLSAVLSGRTGNVVCPIRELPSLALLPVGTLPPNPVELVQRPAFARMMRELQSKFDHIIVDTPAAEHGADYRVIASRCGSALAIARKNESRMSALDTMLGALRKRSTDVAGVLLNEH